MTKNIEEIILICALVNFGILFLAIALMETLNGNIFKYVLIPWSKEILEIYIGISYLLKSILVLIKEACLRIKVTK